MGFRIDFERGAEKDLDGLGVTAARRILMFLHQRLARLDDPHSLGEALKGPVSAVCGHIASETIASLPAFRIGRL